MFGLVELMDGQTAIVNLGQWSELKSGLQTVGSKVTQLNEEDIAMLKI